MMADMLALTVCALALYAALTWLANEYSLRTNWQAPQGSQEMDWVLRRNVGYACGGIAVALCALCCVVWLASWPARLLAVSQAALMAAAGASDLRRFHLPLPFTLAGIGVAVAGLLVTRTPAFLVLFALAWSLAVILLHALVSRGSMQLGDHIATVWIAVAAPFNGLLAVMAGDLTNVMLTRVKGLRGKKVAAAGAWLIFAAALAGLPPYVTWLISQQQAQAPYQLPATEITPLQEQAVVTPAEARRQTLTAAALIKLSAWAGDHTTRVALAERRADRIIAARHAAERVAPLAALARQIAPDSEVCAALTDLAAALSAYDVAQVRSASLRLAEQREQLAPFANASASEAASDDAQQPQPGEQAGDNASDRDNISSPIIFP